MTDNDNDFEFLDFTDDDLAYGSMAVEDEDGRDDGDTKNKADNDSDDTEPKQRLRCHTEKGKKLFDKRRFTSEQNLLKEVDWHFKDGYNYHIMSHGDVDSLSFLKHILRQQPLDYLLISTWCVGIEDVEQMKEWAQLGLVKRFDCYLGEIARASYANAQADLEVLTQSTGGRCGIFRNHSKVMLCYGERFQCVMLASANVNSNPRCENFTIFCDKEITDWYKAFFDGIHPFNGSPDGWTPWAGMDSGGQTKTE